MFYNRTMALIVFKDGQALYAPADKAEHIWRCLEGKESPHTSAQCRYISRVRRVYLNKQTAPSEYLESRGLKPKLQQLDLYWWQK